jgi:iron complex outermembrane receptor protein
MLTARVSYRYYSREGSYDNNAVADKAPGHLGDQSTQSVNFEIVAKPIENLKIKALGIYWHDDDGPSAQALILPSQSNCLGFWFCGTVPDRLSSQPAANTLVTPAIQRLLAYLGTPAGQQVFKPLNNKYGLVRDAYHASIGIDYYVPSIKATFSSLTAVDNQKFSELQDLANDDGSSYPNYAYSLGYPFANSYGDFPFFVEDSYRNVSQEFRVTSDQDTRFRWLVGVNYEWSRVDESLGGGNGFDFFSGHAPTTSKDYGVFFGLDFDIIKQLTLNVEGRYQSDKESAFSAATSSHFNGTYNDFTPRISLQYKFDPDVMAYVTYSEGVNPGTFNSFIPGLPAAEQQYLLTNFGAKVAVPPEHLRNYEAGVKGRFFDGKVTLAADVYYDIWYDQINVNSVQYFVGPTLETTTADVNNGKTHLKGVEADATWHPIAHLDLNAAGAINDTKIVAGGCFTCLERIGTQDVNGNQLPDVSKYQATLGAEYGGSLTAIRGMATWDWFVRVDYVYKSGNYEDRDNLVKTPDENLINLRAGVTHGPLRVEAFVDNLTNWGGPTNLAAIVDLGNPAETYAHTSDALVAGLPQLRTFGIRLKYRFGL